MTNGIKLGSWEKLWLAVAALFLVRSVVAASTGLVDDEAYYRLWAVHPALSYFDHPPMVAWFISLGRYLFGDSTFAIRFAANIAQVVGTLVLARTAYLLYGEEVALLAAWFLLAMPLVAVGGIIITPDCPSVLFAGLTFWTIVELDRSRNANWWLATGLFAGCGLLSKYTNLFVGAGVLIWLLAIPANRHWFRAPQLWLGGVVAALVLNPVVIWNAEHEWISLTKQFGRVVTKGAQRSIHTHELVLGFLGLSGIFIGYHALRGLVQTTRRAYEARASADVLILAAVMPMFAYFVFHSLHGRVQANWLAPAYPAMAIMAALSFQTVAPATLKKISERIAFGTGIVIVACAYLHSVFPIVSLSKDPTLQMHGWTQLAREVENQRQKVGAGWIATSSFATTGQLSYALGDRTKVFQLTERKRYMDMPQPTEDIWSRPALYVELARRPNIDLLSKLFNRVQELQPIDRHDGSRSGAKYRVFMLSEPRGAPFIDTRGY